MLAFGSLAFASPGCCGAGRAAGYLVAVAGDAAGAAPHRVSGDPAAVGLVPREETPARTPLWLILLRMAIAALVILGAGPSAAQSAGAAAGDRTVDFGGRRWLGGGERLGRAPGRTRRSVGRSRARGSAGGAGDHGALGSDAAAATAGTDPRRRCSRRDRGIAAETLAGRSQAALARLQKLSAAAAPMPRSGSATGSTMAARSARQLISPSAAACAI